MKRTLIVAAGVLMIALGALVVVSVERSAWLFGLFELVQDRQLYGRLLAWVAELAIIALIVAKVVIRRDQHPREYFYVTLGLLAGLGLQVLSNLIAGFDRGWQAINAIFMAPGDGAPAVAGRVVATGAWLVSNVIVPVLVYILAELLAHTVRQIIAADDAGPSLIQLLMQLDSHSDGALVRQASDQMAAELVRAERAEADAIESAKSAHRSLYGAQRAASQATELAERVKAEALAALLDSSRTATSQATELADYRQQLQGARQALADAKQAAPAPAMTVAAIVAYLESHAIGIADLAAEAVRLAGSNEAAGRIFGVSGNAVKAWLRNGGSSND